MYNLNDVYATKLFKNLEIEVVMKVFLYQLYENKSLII